MNRLPAVSTFLVLLLAAPTSCVPVRVSMPALVLDGPALHVAGVYSGMRLEGVMDRGCMAGVGTLSLRAVGAADTDKAAGAAGQGEAEDAAATGTAANTKGKTELRGKAADTEKTGKAATKSKAADTGKSGRANAEGSATAAVEAGEADTAGKATAEVERDKAEAKGKVSTAGEKSTGHPADGAGGAAETDEASAPAFACSAKLDVLPDRKARVNGTLECTSGRRMAFSLRNLGPDQGLGIARESQEGGLMVFFYHAAESEAKRRLPQILAEMESLRAGAEK
ncbi:MAG: hypothetical protein LBR82_07735 [Desulfovibrio sp.]|nr:hypothetical protein [Desulfovibrio sp.]